MATNLGYVRFCSTYTHRSGDEELADLVSEVGEPVVEEGQAPGLVEVGVEVLDEALVEPRHEVVEEPLVQTEQADQVVSAERLEIQMSLITM